MSYKSKYLFYKRKFLNNLKWKGPAFILAEIEKTESKWTDKKTKKTRTEIFHCANIQIADCNRVINLEMDCDSLSAANKNLKKLDRLIKVLTEFRKVYVKCIEDMRKRNGNKKNKKRDIQVLPDR